MRDRMRASIFAASAAFLAAGAPAVGAERTVILAVDNLYCPSCPYIVREALADVPGVRSVEVSYDDKTSVVVFDDEEAAAAALTEATARIGFPSRLLPR